MGKKQKQDTETVAVDTATSDFDSNKYNSELLVRSKLMSKFGLHKDILRAILSKESYTIGDAERAVLAYLKSDAFKVEK